MCKRHTAHSIYLMQPYLLRYIKFCIITIWLNFYKSRQIDYVTSFTMIDNVEIKPFVAVNILL